MYHSCVIKLFISTRLVDLFSEIIFPISIFPSFLIFKNFFSLIDIFYLILLTFLGYLDDKISLNYKIKFFVIVSLTFLLGFLVLAFPSVFLKQSNRTFLNSLGFENVEIFTGSGGGNYIKKVYKEYLITLDEKELIDRFGI